MKKICIVIIYCFILIPFAKGEIIYEKEDSLIYESYIHEFESKRDLSNSELLKRTANFFLNKPYVASTLEQKEEVLVVNLREFDCVTFVETCVALVLNLKSKHPSFEEFCHTLQSIRYRNGEVQDYTSRLHYTSDWIYENEKNGILEDVSEKFGGKKIVKPVNFMTMKPHLYEHLKNNPECILKMEELEENINNRNKYVVILSSNISDMEDNIKNGDIITFATKINGLDYSHLGIAYWLNAELHFIHASSRKKKIVIEEKSLSSYCKELDGCSGISVLNFK